MRAGRFDRFDVEAAEAMRDLGWKGARSHRHRVEREYHGVNSLEDHTLEECRCGAVRVQGRERWGWLMDGAA